MSASLAFLLALAETVSSPRPQLDTETVDFIYFEQQDLYSIVVPFGLNGFCNRAGVVVPSSQGVWIEDVRADGRNVAILKGLGYYHDRPEIVIGRPGSSFQYRMTMDDLTSEELGTNRSRHFVIAQDQQLPARLEILYRIRCADGSLSELFKTRGTKYDYPRPSKKGK
jgi:hypothetical protein